MKFRYRRRQEACFLMAFDVEYVYADLQVAAVAARLLPPEADEMKALQDTITSADLTARLLLSCLVTAREASAILRRDRRVMRSLHVSTKLTPK